MVVSALIPEPVSIGLKGLAIIQRGTRSASYPRFAFRVVLPCIHAGRDLWSCYCDPVSAGGAKAGTQREHVPTPTGPWRGASGRWRLFCCSSSLLHPTIEEQVDPCVARKKIFPLPGWGGRCKGHIRVGPHGDRCCAGVGRLGCGHGQQGFQRLRAATDDHHIKKKIPGPV